MAEPTRLRDVTITIGDAELPVKELSFIEHRKLRGISHGEPITATGKVTLMPRKHPRCTALVTIPGETDDA